jgi:LysR family glycine cleavage system transcriptional activator
MKHQKQLSNRFSLNLLKTFAATARLNSFKHAAEELFITPSAVSQQIKDLESFLGTPLFDRHSQGIRLNQIGKLFWMEINPSLLTIIQATESLRAQFKFRQLRISLIPPIANRVIFPHLGDFQSIHPDIQLFFESSEKNIDLLTSSFDLAIRFDQPPWAGCEYEKLLDVTIQPVFNSAVEQAFLLLENIENIVKAPLIHVSHTPDAWDTFFSLVGLTRSGTPNHIFVNDYQVSMEAVQNYGVALALFPLEKQYAATHGLLAPAQFSVPYGAVYAVAKEGRLNEASIHIFLKWLKNLLPII